MRNGARGKRKDLHLSTGTSRTGTFSDGWSTRTEDLLSTFRTESTHTCTLSFIHWGGDPDAHARLFYVSLVHNASGAPPTLYNHPTHQPCSLWLRPLIQSDLTLVNHPFLRTLWSIFAPKKKQNDNKHKSVWINYLAMANCVKHWSSAMILIS